jgi:hypothetical protein
MADLGMNIVTVIHQPRYSVFSLFHEVLLLGKAGRTVFQGLSRCTPAAMHSLFALPERYSRAPAAPVAQQLCCGGWAV